MLRRILLTIVTLFAISISTPAIAGEDFGWCNGSNCHNKYYVMNVENDGFLYWHCLPASDAEKNWKLQVKLNGKKSAWKTVTTGTAVYNQFDSATMQKYNWYISCADEPNNPIILIFNWSPSNWQKDYPARIVYGKKNTNFWSGSIVIHPNLRKTKPIWN